MVKFSFAILLSMYWLSGCAGYSMHSLRDVSIKISDLKTNELVAGIEITVTYDYDSYGLFYFANTQQPVSGWTDAIVTVLLPIANYRYRTVMKIGDVVALLNKELIQDGGEFTVPFNRPVYNVKLLPL